MKIISTWTPPVAVSLLLHAALLGLVTYRMSASDSEKSQAKTLTVELLGRMPASVSKAPAQTANPVKTKQPVPAPAQTEPVPIANAATQEPQSAAATAENQSSSSHEANTDADSKSSALVIHSLSKLTRPPGYLRKIEPVYPAAEQRAGSQANVLAEVTIDDKGNVLGVRIVKSAGKHFDEAVIAALQKSMFVPGYIDREAVAVRVLVPFRFNLK